MDGFAPVEAIARTATAALAFGVLESALLAGIVFLTIRCSRPSATTRHVLWWMVLWAAAALPIASIGASLGHIEHRHITAATFRVLAARGEHRVPRERAGRSERSERTTIDVTFAPRRELSGAGLAPAQSQPVPAIVSYANAAWARVNSTAYAATAAVAVWLAVSLAALLTLVRSLVSLRRIKRDATPLDESVVRRLRRWRHSTRVGRPVAIRVSNDVDVPVAVGFRTPTILLPARVVEIEEIADIDQIAMHEYAHLNRYDDWSNLAQRVLERVFWFNPIVALVGRRISLEREIACDDWVVAQTGRAHRYATCLWKLVESSRLPAAPIFAPGALLSPRQITIRIEQLLDSRRNALPRLSPVGAVAVGALCVALVVAQTLRAPAIAIVDPDPASAGHVTTVASPTRPAPTPHPAPSPHPMRKTYVLERRELRVETDASPATIATAVAAAVSASERDVVKATVATHLRESVRTAQAEAQRAARAEQALAKAAANAADVVKATAAMHALESVRTARAEAQDAARAQQTLAKAAAAAGADFGADIAARVVQSIAAEPALPGPEVAPARGTHASRESLERCFGCNLHGADLRNLDLHGLVITGADLQGADLRGADLRNTKFTGTNLRDVRLAGADLRGASFIGCELGGTDLTRASLDGASIVGTSIRGVNVAGTHLRSLVDGCEGCDLRGLDLHGQDLRDIKIVGADLRDADLRSADLRGARLEAVDLRGAKLEGLKLDGATLEHCDLEGLQGIHNTL